jgi:hypothetical protein
MPLFDSPQEETTMLIENGSLQGNMTQVGATIRRAMYAAIEHGEAVVEDGKYRVDFRVSQASAAAAIRWYVSVKYGKQWVLRDANIYWGGRLTLVQYLLDCLSISDCPRTVTARLGRILAYAIQFAPKLPPPRLTGPQRNKGGY